MTRINVREVAGGNRAHDDNSNTTTEETTTTMSTNIRDQFFAEEAAREAEHQRQIAGDFTPPKRAGDIDLTVGDSVSPGVTGRDAYLARELAMSRAPATGAGSEARVSAADLEVDDDDDSTTFATGSARDFHQQREVERSRLPARGAR